MYPLQGLLAKARVRGRRNHLSTPPMEGVRLFGSHFPQKKNKQLYTPPKNSRLFSWKIVVDWKTYYIFDISLFVWAHSFIENSWGVRLFLRICWGFWQWHIPEPSLGRDPKTTDCGGAFAKLWESERPVASFSIGAFQFGNKKQENCFEHYSFDCWFCWGCSIFDMLSCTQFAFVPKWPDALKRMVSCSMYHWPSTIFCWRIDWLT